MRTGKNIMEQRLIIAFEALLDNATGVNPEQRKNILAACQGSKKRRFVKRKEVLKLLGLSGPTLLKLIRAGKIEVFKLSPRKCRFDLDQIESIANGVE